MTARRFVTLALLCLALSAGSADAAPLELTLVRTSVIYNEDPAAAPVPLGRTQYDAGDVMLGEQKVGEYLRVKDVHDGTLNVASVTTTLFFPAGSELPLSITLQGVHSFDTGNQRGSVSGGSVLGITGIGYSLVGATDVLTLQFP